ncbi:Velvet factor [Ceraceosorus bombacis]|uniref:Velvet factor n=1 Tax=Ceraceosorus bombacis TaxID=401625 RepID=A0A0P1BRP3_9BASI|nr:Velvet factor [Ceraceosorus bombacis]
MGSSSALVPSSASPWFSCPSVDHTLRIHQGLPPATQVKFQLRIIQQPQEALAVGEGTDVHKQARNLPLDPPPVCELVTRDDTFANFLHLPEVSLRAHLVEAAAPHKELLAGPEEQGALINGIHEGAFVAPITDSVTRSFFIFTEIGIRASGQFRIRFDLVDRAGLSFKHVASVYTDPFTAHSDRNQFSGLQRSSELLRAVARRGLKVRIVDVLPLNRAFKRRKTEAAATAFRNISAPVSSMQPPAFYPRQRQSDQLPSPLLHSAEDLQTTRHASYESSPRPMVDTRAIPQIYEDPLRSVDLASRGPADVAGPERTSEANSNRNKGRFSAPIGAVELERVKLPPPNPYRTNQHVPRYAQTPLRRASTDLDGGRHSATFSHFSGREENFLGSTGPSGHPRTSASGSRRQTFVDYERRRPSDVAFQDRGGSSSSLDADRHGGSLLPSRLQRRMDALPSELPPPADPLNMRDGASIGPDTLPPPSSIFSRVIARPMRELGRYEIADDDARRADLSDDEVHARRLFHARTEGSMAPPAAAEIKGPGGSSTRPQDFEHTVDASHRFRDQSRREGDADVQDGYALLFHPHTHRARPSTPAAGSQLESAPYMRR